MTQRLSEFTDPRRNLGQLPDSAPLILFPVRIETRFVAGPELLVRIYPDDCSIDTFEPQLSATELVNVKRYWQNFWRSAGVEANQRAAWRNLVAAHGSGRAGWLLDQFEPTNLADVPVKADASDEVLVIAADAVPAQAAAISAYWRAVWVATDDGPTPLAAARATFESAVGAANADALLAQYEPFNLDDKPTAPLTRHDVAVQVAFVVFGADPATSTSSWTQAPQVRQFPERFIVVGYTGTTISLEAIGSEVSLPLFVGPDPSADPVADPDSIIHPIDGGDLFVPDQLAWMVDFDRAVAAGMALRIPISAAQARTGFDRLLVIGIQLSTADGSGPAILAELLDHHRTGRAGLGLLAQGTPTHNTTGLGTGYTAADDPDASFDDRRNLPLFTPTTDEWAKRDGQWLAEALGVDPALIAQVHGAGNEDQLRARAMQRALWPATLGYWMDKMMTPVFADETVRQIRDFVTRHVRGCGSLPALHIGGQPYGVLATTAFSRIAWLDQRRQDGDGLTRLHALLTAVGPDWAAFATGSAHVGASGDPHQILLDILGLNPSSVEYYSRFAESLDQLFNTEVLFEGAVAFYEKLQSENLEAAAEALLKRVGYGGVAPDLLSHFFLTEASQLGVIIDDVALSETQPVRAYTDDGRNYLQWLADAGRASLDQVVAEQGFTGDVTPAALLYLLLRHALMLGYYDTSYDLHRSTGVLSATALAASKIEAPFIHVAEASAQPTESRFGLLYQAQPLITSSPTQLVAEYIALNLSTLLADAALAEQLAAFDVLKTAPTAALERAFAEHIDICTYRYDAWLLGLVDSQLQAMRALPTDDGQGDPVSYLGAYAWVENLRPSTATLTPVEVPPELQDPTGTLPPVRSDSSNGGYVHAPSMTHARTAAVLRSGYLANAGAANPNTMAVNLSSDRVRAALGVLEGIRNGQSVGALLGYQFELGLHDSYSLAEVDKFIYPLRKAFPLVADALATTTTDPGVPIEAIEARNVMDGRKLAEHITGGASASYPFGLSTLPTADPSESAAINAQVQALIDTYDSIAEVALAEGVHQAVQGNFARVGATLDAYASGTFPPQPEVVSTPNTGQGLTHRVGLQLRPGLTAAVGATPAARAEPALDDWLTRTLPPLNTVGCVVTWTDPVTATPNSHAVTLADLGLAPIDVLDLVLPDSAQSMAELDDRVLAATIAASAPRPDADLMIQYLQAPPGGSSLFEASALVRAARDLVTRARPLRATDVMLSNAAASAPAGASTVVRARVADPKTDLDTLVADVATLLLTLDPLVTDPVTNRATILADVDALLDSSVVLLERAARFRIGAAGWGFAYAWRHDAYRTLITQVADLLTRLDGKLADYDAAITAYDALPFATSEADRLVALQQAELMISTSLIVPTTALALRGQLDGVRGVFLARQLAFRTLRNTAPNTYSGALVALTALLPLTDIDRATFDITPLGDSAVTFVGELQRALDALHSAAAARSSATQQQLDAYDLATTPDAQVAALTAAAKALLGPDFMIIAEFTPPTAAAADWASAMNVSTSGVLLDHLVNTLDIDFPVEEWLTGVARVRPMIKAWETLTALVDAARGPADVPELVPVQLPYEAAAAWVAMAYPSTYVFDSDRLCYTAHYTAAFDPTGPQCGLLLDEWTEAIPAASQDTGLTFNFNRPDNEPPQAILIVTPASMTGHWEWEDVLGALNETLDLAKVRTVDPSAVDATPYAMFVPATIMAATKYGISIGTNLSAANRARRFYGTEVVEHG